MIFPYIQLEPLLLQFIPIASHPPTMDHSMIASMIPLITSIEVLKAAIRPLQAHSLLQAQQAQFLHPVLTDHVLHPAPDYLGGLPLNALHFDRCYSFIVVRKVGCNIPDVVY